MIRAPSSIALSVLLLLGVLFIACHQNARLERNADVGPVIKDPANVVGLFKDTTVTSALSAEARTFKLQTPGQRQSLHATLRKERELWQAGRPSDYEFLLRVSCFCPGTRGWLLVEVRRNQPLRAWDRTGKSVSVTDWNTFSLDGLYENLERAADDDGEVQIAFDPHWHFPTYVRSVVLRGPDAWSIIEARALHH